MEDKEAIIKSFVRALQLTRIGENITEGEYFKDKGDETAILYIRDRNTGKHRSFTVNITADSGLSIMKDIIFALEN
ncbi:MAG: hypothetical protein IKS18_03660 [Lachnospiraceae bacterium]|nr:hypothetical protein [Lachnospiraceae bacterium]